MYEKKCYLKLTLKSFMKIKAINFCSDSLIAKNYLRHLGAKMASNSSPFNKFWYLFFVHRFLLPKVHHCILIESFLKATLFFFCNFFYADSPYIKDKHCLGNGKHLALIFRAS